MSTHEVSSVLARIDGLNIHQLPKYQQSVEENNINGMVLSSCELDELGKVLEMKFGDWQLFKTVILSLREAEELEVQIENDRLGEDDADTQESSRRIRTNSVMSAKSIHFQDPESSGSSSSNLGVEGPRSRNGFARQGSVDTQRLDSNEIPTVFDTIEEDPEAPPKSKLLRNDSVIAELMYESGLLRQAMQSYAEDDEPDDDDGEEEQEQRVEAPSSKTRGLPVQFSLSSHGGTIPDLREVGDNKNQNYDEPTEHDPLIMRERSDSNYRVYDGSVPGSPKPILKKPKTDKTKTDSEVSLNNIHFLSDIDISGGSVTDLSERHKRKPSNLLQPEKSVSLSSTGFPAFKDIRRASSGGYSVDSVEVINEVQREPERDTASTPGQEQTSPQRMQGMSIEDSIRQFTMSRAASLHGSEDNQTFDGSVSSVSKDTDTESFL